MAVSQQVYLLEKRNLSTNAHLKNIIEVTTITLTPQLEI